MSYKIAYNASLAPPRHAAIVAFMEDFYRTSDTESLHERYVQSFTEDATLIMGPKEAKGASGMFLRSNYNTRISSTCPMAIYLSSACYPQDIGLDHTLLRPPDHWRYLRRRKANANE